MATERRAFLRKAVSAPASFTDAWGDVVQALSHDVCRGGCFIASPSTLPAGESIELEIRFPSGTIKAKGRVVWVRETTVAKALAGMGIAFVEIDDASLAIIGGLTAAPAPVKRASTVLGVAPPQIAAAKKPPEPPPPEPAPVETEPPAQVETEPPAPVKTEPAPGVEEIFSEEPAPPPIESLAPPPALEPEEPPAPPPPPAPAAEDAAPPPAPASPWAPRTPPVFAAALGPVSPPSTSRNTVRWAVIGGGISLVALGLLGLFVFSTKAPTAIADAAAPDQASVVVTPGDEEEEEDAWVADATVDLPDTSVLDSSTRDASLDAGRDSGKDAGRDAGRDAGKDAGHARDAGKVKPKPGKK